MALNLTGYYIWSAVDFIWWEDSFLRTVVSMMEAMDIEPLSYRWKMEIVNARLITGLPVKSVWVDYNRSQIPPAA